MRVSSTSKLDLAFAVAVVVSLAPSCDRGDLGRGARTTTTSATVPRPETTAATSRTIDNAGFVDNGGRTSEMTSRTEASGMRATESGSERVTGTPGSGQAIPIEPGLPRGESGEEQVAAAPEPAPPPVGPLPRGGRAIEAIARIAQARCDREAACNRVGQGRAWGTQDSCMVEQRERARRDVAALSCRNGIDALSLGACLNTVRLTACNESTTPLDTVTACRTTAVCAP